MAKNLSLPRNISEVNLEEPIKLRLFQYAVYDGKYSDDFFDIKNIDSTQVKAFEHYINVLDKADQLVSRFGVVPEYNTEGKPFLLAHTKIGSGHLIPVRDSKGNRVVENVILDETNNELRYFKLQELGNVPLPYVTQVNKIMRREDGRPVSARNFTTTWFSENSSKRNVWKDTEVSPANKNDTDAYKYLNSNIINPTKCYTTKLVLRRNLSDSISSRGVGKVGIEIITVKIGNAEPEQRDEQGNIIVPARNAEYKDIMVQYNFRTQMLELAKHEFERFTAETILSGRGNWQTKNADTMTIAKQVEDWVATCDPVSLDKARKAAKFMKELDASNNRVTMNEEGEIISQEGAQKDKATS